MNILPIASACLALALLACGSEAPADTAVARAATPPPASAAEPGASPYRFDRPAARFELPDALVEISGLTVLPDGSLGAIQDEEGDLYVLSAESGEVLRVVPFGPPGDYEGIESVGERLFVLRADGAVLELSGWEGERATSTVTETGLGAGDCDAEGLGTDGQRLLIACKKEVDGTDRSRIHAFDLGAMALADEPVFAIDRDDVPGDDSKLRPSALAVHPVTRHTVVLSSKREALVSLDAAGTVVDVWDLSLADFEQPEGLVFLPNGDAFVSSEGSDGPAVLARFAYAPAR